MSNPFEGWFPQQVDDDVTLRLLGADDVALTYPVLVANRAHVGRWEVWARMTTRAEQRAFLGTCAERYAAGRGFACGIWWRVAEPERLVGVVTVAIDDAATAEFSYWLSQDATGHGIVTRCMRQLGVAVLRLAAVTRLQLVIAEPNAPSRAVATRLGYIQTDVRPRDRLVDGDWIDRLVYIKMD